MTTFGPGDYGGYNDWAFSGSNSFWTNWNTSTFATGVLGRITAIAARWDCYSGFCAATTGHNDVWDTSNNLAQSTGSFSTTCRAAGTTETMHNATCNDLWQNNASYYIGFSRTNTQCSIHAWKDNSNGGYAGKSANDGTNSGGTTNWGGSTNGGMPVFGTVTDTNVYVRRGGAWTKTFVYVRRSGAWTGPVYVYVRRSGAWTLLNELKEHEIPKNGEEALVDVGEGLERGWIVEEGEMSWFGSEDPTTQEWDWRIPGHYEWSRQPWTGRFNSHEPEEVAYKRLEDQWKNLQGEVPIIRKKKIFESADIPEPVFDDPEPILLDCNCGG